MQNSDSKGSRTRQHPWCWASLRRSADNADLDADQQTLTIQELMALTSDQSVRAQRDYRINSARPPRG